MRILIVGAGDVGSYLCGLLSEARHNVTLIETSTEAARHVDEQYDVKVLPGNGSSAGTLVEAGVANCDFFLALTSDDQANLISTSLAKALGARNTIARIHDQTYQDNSYLNYQLHFGIDYTLNPEALCAVELAKSIRNPGRVAVENFARGQVEVQRVQVNKKSKLLGRPLHELGLSRELRIGFVQRGEHSEVASAGTVLQEGDKVTLFGSPDALFEHKGLFEPEGSTDPVRVVLFGGGETAIALARLLSGPRFKVRIVDGDVDSCRYLAEQFPEVTVIHGDVTSLRLMEEEQIGHCDYFVACTKRDEDNIMTGLQATKLGSAHVQLVINRVDYEQIIDKMKWLMGVELAVSPRVATAREVLRYLSTEPFIELATLPDEVGKIIEVQVGAESYCAGKTLREVPWPQGCVVVALLHKFVAKVPGADDVILGGDRVVVISQEENLDPLLRLLTGGEN